MQAPFESALHSIQRINSMGVDFIFLVDGSGSMKTGWGVMTFVLRALARYVLLSEEKNSRNEHKYRVAVVQFGTATEIVCQFTGSAQTVAAHCQDLKMIDGGTATHKGLEVCRDLFNGTDRGATCCCILFTDGSPDDQKMAEKVADSLANDPKLKVEMIGVGIGPHINRVQLSKVTPLRDFYVASIEELKKLISDMNSKPAGPPTVHPSAIYPRSIKMDFELSEDVASFEIKKYNHQKASYVTIQTTPLPEYLLTDLAPDTEHIIQVIAHLRRGGTSPPGTLKFKTPIEPPQVPLMANTARLIEENAKLRDEILNYRPPEDLDCDCVNILMAGRVGSGKSSFLNTTFSALYGSYEPMAIAGNRTTSTTLAVTKYNVEVKKEGKSFIRLWDVYGWTLQNYQSEFEGLLAGTLNNGYREGMKSNLSVANEGEKMFINSQPTFSDRVHAVILLTDPFSIKLEAENNRLCFFRDKFADVGGLQGHVLVTKLDVKDPTLVNHPDTVYANPFASTLLADLREKLGAQMGIHPMINYLADYGDNRNHAIEYLALSALTRALRQAKTFIKGQAGKRPTPPPVRVGVPVGDDRGVVPPVMPIVSVTCECGEKLDSSWKVCPSCEREVIVISPFCQVCAMELKPHWTRCPKCTTIRPKSEPPKLKCKKCGEVLEPNYKLCPECNTLVN